jgi:hypothetical protein
MLDRALAGDDWSRPTAKPARVRCPLFPMGKAVPTSGQGSLPRPSFLLRAPQPAAAALPEQVGIRPAGDTSGSRLVRGPPAVAL